MPLPTPFMYNISPEYFAAAGTALLAGRTFTWHDDKNAPRVAVVNQEFARKIFGSVTNAIGRYYKMRDGTRIQVVGIVEDGKYLSLTEDPQPAMFLPILQSPSTSASAWWCARDRDPQQLAAAIKSTAAGPGCGAACLHRQRGPRNWTSLCFLRAWRRCRWVCWA